LLVFAATSTTWHTRDAVIFLALLACGIAATEANRSVREPQGTLARDLQGVWYLAIAITLPPWYALAAPIPFAVHKLWRIRRMLVDRRGVRPRGAGASPWAGPAALCTPAA